MTFNLDNQLNGDFTEAKQEKKSKKKITRTTYFDEKTQGIYTQKTRFKNKNIYAQVKLRQSKVIWTNVK